MKQEARRRGGVAGVRREDEEGRLLGWAAGA